jgi:hypothetical protein
MASHITPGPAAHEEIDYADKSEGPVAAAIIAAGVGALFLGILTTTAEASTSIKDFLSFYDPVGPLSGKTIGAVAIWLVSWVVLHVILKDKSLGSRTALTAALVLIGLGVIGTFPIFFQLFAPAE